MKPLRVIPVSRVTHWSLPYLYIYSYSIPLEERVGVYPWVEWGRRVGHSLFSLIPTAMKNVPLIDMRDYQGLLPPPSTHWKEKAEEVLLRINSKVYVAPAPQRLHQSGYSHRLKERGSR